MAGVHLTFDSSDYERVIAALEQWATGVNMTALNRSLGAEIESQTRRRLQDEKTAPDGTPWADWSPRYALTRHQRQSLLSSDGDLMDSLSAFANARQVEVGTDLPYGAPHQFGFAKRNIPARPFLGLSTENAEDLLNVAEDWVDTQLGSIGRGP